MWRRLKVPVTVYNTHVYLIDNKINTVCILYNISTNSMYIGMERQGKIEEKIEMYEISKAS